MSPRLEIDVPIERLPAFREYVATFDGAQVLKDEERIAAERALQLKSHRELVDSLFAPKPSEVETMIGQGYEKLLRELFLGSRWEDRKVERVNLDSLESRIVLGSALLEIFRTMPTELAFLVTRYGLGDGKYKTQTEAREILNISKSRASRVEKRVLRVLRHPEIRKMLSGWVEFAEP